MNREYVAMLATMSTSTGRARWWARSMTKLRPPPGSTSLRLAMGKILWPVHDWIWTVSTWSISASQNNGIARPRKLKVVAV